MLPRDVITLSPEQFDKIVELLTPGYELAKAYLAAQQAPHAAEIEADRFDTTKEEAETLEETAPVDKPEPPTEQTGEPKQGDSGDETK